jgi:competence protein ComEA
MVKYKNIIVIIIVVFIGVAGFIYNITPAKPKEKAVILTKEETPKGIPNETQKSTDDSKKEDPPIIYVHICGEVVSPGVYELLGSSRVKDLIFAAGGLTQKASPDYVNQAEVLTDGKQIYIPSKEEVKDLGKNKNLVTPNDTEDETKSLININTASKEELMTIPGIGEAKAGSIIKYREECGNFNSIEDIKNIEGIKDGVFNKMKEYITVS